MRDMLLQTVNLLIGPIPDILYFTFFIICTKKLKKRKILLTVLIALTYITCIVISKYNIFWYLAFYFLVYIEIYILYREEAKPTDIFLILFSSLYLSFISYICFKFVKQDFSNYYLMLFVNKLLLCVPFLLKEYINKIYINYCKLWNRNDYKDRKIKSITLRNISLIILNCFLFISNLIYIYIKTL